MEGITQVILLGEGLQHLQGWPDYRTKRYNCSGDGSQIPIGSILIPPLSGYITHLADIRDHNLLYYDVMSWHAIRSRDLGSRIPDNPSYDTRRRRRSTPKARLQNTRSPELRYETMQTLDPQDTALDQCIIQATI